MIGKRRILFAFSFNEETQEASIAGNIELEEALAVLNALHVASLVKDGIDKERAARQPQLPKERVPG